MTAISRLRLFRSARGHIDIGISGGADRRSLCCMSTAAVAVGHWLVIILVIILVVTSVVMRVQRNRLRRQRDEMRRSRVRRQRDETPEDRYRREPPDFRRSQTSLGGGSDAADAP